MVLVRENVHSTHSGGGCRNNYTGSSNDEGYCCEYIKCERGGVQEWAAFGMATATCQASKKVVLTWRRTAIIFICM